MERKIIKTIVWLINKMGYKVAMIRAKDGCVDYEGNKELIRYIDHLGYIRKMDPIKRDFQTVKDDIAKKINGLK